MPKKEAKSKSKRQKKQPAGQAQAKNVKTSKGPHPIKAVSQPAEKAKAVSQPVVSHPAVSQPAEKAKVVSQPDAKTTPQKHTKPKSSSLWHQKLSKAQKCVILFLMIAFPFFGFLGYRWGSTVWEWIGNIPQYAQYIPQEYRDLVMPLPVIAACLVVLILGKIFYQLTLSFSLPKELTENDNPAVGLNLAGFLLGIGFALVGATYGLEPRYAFLGTLVCLIVCVPLMRLSGVIQDKILLYKFSIAKELTHDRNLGTGAVCCGGFIGTGLILMSSFIGESPVATGVISHCLHFLLGLFGAYLLGQAIFILGAFLFQKTVKYNFHHEIGSKDNVSAGIILGSFLVGLGLVVSAAIHDISATDSFYLDIACQKELNQQTIPQVLKDRLDDRLMPLSLNATVTVKDRDKKWTLEDKENKREYVVTKEKDEEILNVYTGTNWKSLARQLLFAGFTGIIGIFVLLVMGILVSMLIFPKVSLNDEVRQKNPAVALVMASAYLTVGLITYAMLR